LPIFNYEERKKTEEEFFFPSLPGTSFKFEEKNLVKFNFDKKYDAI